FSSILHQRERLSFSRLPFRMKQPYLAKGRGPDAVGFCSLVFLNADFLRNSVKSLGGNIPQVAQTW
ncbi:hypothetical protein NG799_29280, partial [Laspinema sp. D1]|nr:hypothetical protein [Laspinema sp. D2a]